MLLPLLVIFASCDALLRPNFGNFVRRTYGVGVVKMLNRADLSKGGDASFGGAKGKSRYRPVVFVHGLRNRAGNFWKHRNIFAKNRFSIDHLIATTYGPGDTGLSNSMSQSMHCSYVKQVRFMIESTIRFYNQPVDVLAYSMGSPIARKAILGGKCVDTGEDLGPSLTNKIVTFLSVAGANHGSALCTMPLPGICNMKNGLACGSKFLKDINSKKNYEGKHIYSLASTGDEIIGVYTICGKKSFEMGSYTEVLKHGLNHEAVFMNTIQDQVNIIKKFN